MKRGAMADSSGRKKFPQLPPGLSEGFGLGGEKVSEGFGLGGER
jgi:hypothetical protein